MRLTELISPEDLRAAIHSRVPQTEMNRRCDENEPLIKELVAFIKQNGAIPVTQRRHAEIAAVFVVALIDEAIEAVTKGRKN